MSNSEQLSLDDSSNGGHKKHKIIHPSGFQTPAAFWDNLSKIWLTSRALRELDRRNHDQLHRDHQTSTSVLKRRHLLQPVTRSISREIQKLASEGGPDLSDLRGYQEPVMTPSPHQSKYSAQKEGLRKSQDLGTGQSTESVSTKNIEPYDQNFEQHLIDHGIYPYGHVFEGGRVAPQPNNWSDIKERLARPRPSLSASVFTEEAHKKFVRADTYASNKNKVLESVISMIEGDNDDNPRCASGGIPFENLDHLTNGKLAPGNPDRYYGATPEQLDQQIRLELENQIIPSTQHDLPIVPNFFLATNGPDGVAGVANKEANYEGVLGARGICSLQQYGKDKLTFDNNAYTISATYNGGLLKLFSIHPSKSATSDQPEYFMNLIKGWYIASDVETFREGATWYRNARDWAKEQRDNAIQQANEQLKRNIAEFYALY